MRHALRPTLPPALPLRRFLAGLLGLALMALAAGPAAAHAVVVTSDPAAGAALAAAPAGVTIRFNSRLDHGRSRLLLIGPDGAQQPLPIAADSEPTVLAAPVASAGPGQWRLRWQVLAVDGHITRGDIPFSIRAR
ncbi:copper resistance CopC family protein [Paeniroseomonas aquatica]|uniref:Copper resistance protein CopC n=1 Tax=Paeniroseomonas aquatica TaxID=373043 RepID=A0ABT8A538_9PROT|nr:copper resistance CopC family protein [Paeniroseomonas aquatica]MDN3564770.1 copper resistance protein CopC [Paeniroseomonas aquatica]